MSLCKRIITDAAYTERYMGLDRVNDNAEGYKVSDQFLVSNHSYLCKFRFQNANALTNFEAFKKGKFLLAHGTADGTNEPTIS